MYELPKIIKAKILPIKAKILPNRFAEKSRGGRFVKGVLIIALNMQKAEFCLF